MTSLSTMGKFEHKVMIIWVWYSHGCTWKIVEENGHCLFFQFSFVFSALPCWKNHRQPYVMMLGLWLLFETQGIRVENQSESYFAMFWSPFDLSLGHGETDGQCFQQSYRLFVTLLQYCPFVFFSPNKPEIVQFFCNNLS